MMSEPRTKQQILDDLEHQTLIVADNLRVLGMIHGKPGALVECEDILGEMIKDVLELKKLEGIPSDLSIVEGETN